LKLEKLQNRKLFRILFPTTFVSGKTSFEKQIMVEIQNFAVKALMPYSNSNSSSNFV